mmetsp:Transcript_5935/g.13856  ORF Transcript_5935/g.13856 Transcript_5935/m.13856 type:complete len:266 (+) Transcript_5935:398-1195(+)
MEGNRSLLASISFGENLFVLFRSLFLDRSDPDSFFSFCFLLLLVAALVLVVAAGFDDDDDVPPAPRNSSQDDKPWDTVSSPVGASLELLVFVLASIGGGGGSREETRVLPLLSFILLLLSAAEELLFFFLFLLLPRLFFGVDRGRFLCGDADVVALVFCVPLLLLFVLVPLLPVGAGIANKSWIPSSCCSILLFSSSSSDEDFFLVPEKYKPENDRRRCCSCCCVLTTEKLPKPLTPLLVTTLDVASTRRMAEAAVRKLTFLLPS